MVLTKSRRIILNTLATYGRSVFALFVGVFSSRWLLQGLGAEDLGLQGVVGSLIGAIIIFETVMQVAVSRFYAFAIGETLVKDVEKDIVCRWFNVVLFIHLLLPLLILIVGCPLGFYAIRHWLTIPAERMEACIFVFNCSMVATFIGMVSRPYIAMYQAKQEIVELSVFGVLRTAINFGFTFSLLYVTCDRLKYSGLFGAVVAVAIAFVYPSRYEGFGIPILDAFAAGCPVILSRASCFPEVAGDAALYFDLDDEAGLRNQVQRLMCSDLDTLRRDLIAKGRARVSDFSWQKCAEQTADVYRKTLIGKI